MANSTRKSVKDEQPEKTPEVTAEEPKAKENGSKQDEKPKKEEVVPTDRAKIPAPTYTIEDLANASQMFNTSYAIVATALKIEGKERATVEEARTIIENFKNKEVN